MPTTKPLDQRLAYLVVRPYPSRSIITAEVKRMLGKTTPRKTVYAIARIIEGTVWNNPLKVADALASLVLGKGHPFTLSPDQADKFLASIAGSKAGAVEQPITL